MRSDRSYNDIASNCGFLDRLIPRAALNPAHRPKKKRSIRKLPTYVEECVTTLLRCKTCSLNTNVPRSWNAVVAVNATRRGAAVCPCWRLHLTASATSHDAKATASRLIKSMTSKRPSFVSCSSGSVVIDC